MPRLKRLELRLHIHDFARSVAFYRDVLEFRVDAVFPDKNPSFALLSRDGVRLQIGGIATHKAPETPPTCTLYLDVQNALDWHKTLRERVAIEWGPEVYFYGRREFAFRDPDGHLVIISEVTKDPVTTRET